MVPLIWGKLRRYRQMFWVVGIEGYISRLVGKSIQIFASRLLQEFQLSREKKEILESSLIR